MMVIGIAGGSGSGKTTVVKALTEQLKEKVVVLPQDSYYKDSSHLPLEERQKVNFDHPDSIDFPLLTSQLEQLKQGKTIEQPVYSYLTCSRSKTETITVTPAEVIIIEGILIFTCAELRKQMDCRIVKPMYLQFIEPSKRYADIIIPQGGHNKVAIEVIAATIEKAMQQKK